MKRLLFRLAVFAMLSIFSVRAWNQASAQEQHHDPASEDGPDASVAVNAVVTVDWKTMVRTVSPLAYGLNCPSCFDPVWSSSPVLLTSLRTITAGARPLIRLHGWGMVTQGSGQCWLNEDGTWNGEKIKRALTPLVQSGYRLMIDIPSGPGGEKDPIDEAAMAPFVAALVKIVNVDNRFGVRYWELPNEREHILSATRMGSMLSRASDAMKKVDPTVLVGGPGAEGINVNYIEEMVQHSLPAIDFVTAHTYGGDGKQSAAVSYQSAMDAVSEVRKLRERLTAVSQGKHLPIFVDEYNIGWDGNPAIYNNEGAVYFSIIQTGIIDSGAEASAVWDFSPAHDMSIVDREGHLRDSAHLFSLMNQYFYGGEARTSSSDPAIHSFAVKSKRFRSVILTNLSALSKAETVRFPGWKPNLVDWYQISNSGYTVKTGQTWNKSGTTALPANSVTILVAY